MKILIILVSVIISLGAVLPAYALDLTLWVPQNMIAGQSYHGVVIIDEPTPAGSLVLLSVKDNLIANTQDSVLILPWQNHGIFSITPKSNGNTQILAIVDGRLSSSDVEVFSSKSAPSRLEIITPANKTSANSMLAYVVVLDENGSPVLVRENTPISITTTSAINGPAGVVIKNGTSFTRFEVDTKGSGDIIASADNLRSHSIHIQKIQNKVTVKIAVAPDIAMEDSYVFYYVWLEKDGKPFQPPYTVDMFLHSNDPDVGRFDTNPHTANHRGILVYLIDGVARGKLYTGDRGYATITASIPDFDSAQDVLFVGPARFSDGDITPNKTIKVNEQNFGDATNKDHSPNLLLSWIYPSVTDDDAWGIIAMYFVDKKEFLDMVVDDAGEISGVIAENSLLVPARADGRTIYVASSQSLDHNGAYVIAEHLTKTNAMEFELHGVNQGNHKITVSGPGLESSESTVDIISVHTQAFEIGITPIPAISGIAQDLAMVSVFDDDGVLVDAVDVFGTDVRFLVSASSIRLADDAIYPKYSGSAILSGVLFNPATITMILDDVGIADAELIPARTPSSLEILAPQSVHVGEDFPFVVHQIDQMGVPVQKTHNHRISSPLDISIIDDIMTIKNVGVGNTSIISNIGAAEKEFRIFENMMDVNLDLIKTDFRVGQNITINVENSVDAHHTMDVDIPFEKIDDDTFVLMPDKKQSLTFTILATKDGYESVSLSGNLNILQIFSLDISTTDPAGMRLYPSVDLHTGSDTVSVVPPYYKTINPDPLRITFPQKYVEEDRGYVFEKMQINGKQILDNNLDIIPTQDVIVIATYEHEILINVTDAAGSGIYREGDTVRISAPDRDLFWFLIRDVFDHWQGFDGFTSDETFVAVEDASIVAVYKPDYTYMMVIIIIPVLTVSAYTIAKSTTSFRWMIQNILEMIMDACKSLMDTKKKKPNPI